VAGKFTAAASELLDRDDGKGGYEVLGATTIVLHDLSDVLKMVSIAECNRTVDSTDSNATSSRRSVALYYCEPRGVVSCCIEVACAAATSS
jgi:hypothetical protein